MTAFNRDWCLQRLCLQQISQTVWRKTTLKYHLAENVTLLMKPHLIIPSALHRDIDELPIPEELKDRLKLTIGSMGTNLYFWMMKFTEHYEKSINELVDCIGLVHWKDLGTIDESQTMRSLYFHGHLPITSQTWEQLAEGCIEDCIRDLWSKFVDLCLERPCEPQVSRKSWRDIICKCIKSEEKEEVDDYHIKMIESIRSGFSNAPASQYWANLLWNQLSEEKRSALEMMMMPHRYVVRTVFLDHLPVRSLSQGLRKRNIATIKYFWSAVSDDTKKRMLPLYCSFYWEIYSIPRFGETVIVIPQIMDIDLIIFLLEQMSLLEIDDEDMRLFRLNSLMIMLDMMPDRKSFLPIVIELMENKEFPIDSKFLMSILRFMQVYQTYVKKNANCREIFYIIFEKSEDKLGNESIFSLLAQCWIMAEFEIAKFILDKQSCQVSRNFFLHYLSRFAITIESHRVLDESYYNFLWNFRSEALRSTDERSYFFGPFLINS